MASQIMGFQPITLLLFTVFIVQFSNASHLKNSFNSFKSRIKQGDATIWAVLVAGSSDFSNYRHQADVCHAYQILKENGLNDENIIVFMYDDIADNPDNPRPGVIINNPEGPDVYAGVPKDYTGDSVNAENFFAALLGNTSGVNGGSRKVITRKSNEEINIFLYYADHGSPGVLGMPTQPYIYADDFNHVLKTMHANGIYEEMVIYLEACESGSIFEGLLPEDINIYVTTAADPDESSWATYCPGTSTPPPPEYDTCLGDLYSVSWMEDSECEDLTSETLEEQYEKVKERTSNNNRGSHVMQYGTLDISNDPVSVFQGSASTDNSTHRFPKFKSMGVISQRDADLYSMRQKYKKLPATEKQQRAKLYKKIKEVTAHRAHLDNSVSMIKRSLLGGKNVPARSKGSALVDDWRCLKSMVRTFEKHCGSLTQYGMKHTRTFANLCNSGVTNKAMDAAAKKTCGSFKMGQWDPEIVGYSS